MAKVAEGNPSGGRRQTDTYDVVVRCENCGLNRETVSIAKGKPVSAHSCPACGVAALLRTSR